MNEKKVIKALSENLSVFKYLLKNQEKDKVQWKPNENSWSLLEVVCHLLDEEKYDFKARINHLFQYPNTPPPPIDPQGWVVEKAYYKQDYLKKVQEFFSERENSISWLNSLKKTAWENSFQHPHFGNMSASLFLTNWLAHDYFHFRQIAKINYLYLQAFSKHNLNYAGGI